MDPEVTNSAETSVGWAMHQQYSTWDSIHKQLPSFRQRAEEEEEEEEVVEVEEEEEEGGCISVKDVRVLSPLPPCFKQRRRS